MSSFNPNFSHRFSAMSKEGEAFTLDDLTDTIALMAERAAAMVMVISLQFESDDCSMLNNAINFSALNAVESEIKDIAAIVSAFGKAQPKTSPPPTPLGFEGDTA